LFGKRFGGAAMDYKPLPIGIDNFDMLITR
jgi:hypothetical protein